jgi:hypothetical protein
MDTEKKPRKPRAPVTPKPCPVTGIPNTHLKFSYLMPEARTPENLAKYKKKKS